MVSFQEKLAKGWSAGKFLCVGLDPRIELLPAIITSTGIYDRLRRFLIQIIEATRPYALAYKPNLAFFTRYGSEGVRALEDLCAYMRDRYPDVPIILDAKYGDVGDTNEANAEFAFDVVGADAVTLNPYVGREAHEPFLRRADKGCIFLVKTSNPRAEELQDQDIDPTDRFLQRVTPAYARKKSIPLHRFIAYKIADEWNARGNCGVVVGATHLQDLVSVRAIVGAMPILIPGIGKQGGDLAATVKAGRTEDGTGMIINASRSVIHAGSGGDFAMAAAEEAARLDGQIRQYLREAGTL